MDTLYLENATCFFSQRTYEEVALGVGIHYAKDLRSVMGVGDPGKFFLEIMGGGAEYSLRMLEGSIPG